MEEAFPRPGYHAQGCNGWSYLSGTPGATRPNLLHPGRYMPTTSKTDSQPPHRKRLILLLRYRRALDDGLSGSQAVSDLPVSRTTVWRWNKALAERGVDGLKPKRAGRWSVARSHNISGRQIDDVAFLMEHHGCPPQTAWIFYAEHPACPRQLSAFLRSKPTVQASLLECVRRRLKERQRARRQSLESSVS